VSPGLVGGAETGRAPVVRRAALVGELGLIGETNATGDAQKKLDVFGNNTIVDALLATRELIESDLFEYQSDCKYDAIVIMGVIEHLPDYLRVLQQFMTLLKPGGRIFLDGSACTKKYELSSFMVKYIYPGNHSFLVLDDFLNKLAKTPLQVEEIFNDRMSYFHTFVQWAKNFDAHKDFVIAKFGEFDYRRFRLYLWGAAYEFLSRSLDCYRMIIERPVFPGDDG